MFTCEEFSCFTVIAVTQLEDVDNFNNAFHLLSSIIIIGNMGKEVTVDIISQLQTAV